MSNTTITEKPKPTSAVQSQAINATASRRLLTLLAVKLLKRFQTRRGPVLFLSKKICVKYGQNTSLNEASTMQFVATHTSVPVPRVYCAFTHRSRTYILMERFRGEPIGVGWLRRSEDSKAKILRQLKKIVEEMRRVPPPNDVTVAHINGGPLHDPRIQGTNEFGPFSMMQDFHRYLRGGVEAHPQHKPEIRELISWQDQIRCPPVFTHGDLSSLNIIASEDEIVGVVDWETAGWYPPYWEYTTAWNVNPQNQFWQDEVAKFLQPMPNELEMEKIRLKYFADI